MSSDRQDVILHPSKIYYFCPEWQLFKIPSCVYKGNNKITELRKILQRESQNS